VAVLKACSHSKGLSYDKQRELEIIQQVQNMIVSGTYGIHPNEITYGAYMGAIRNCMARSNERTNLLQTTFEQCSSEGYVDIFVLSQLRRSISNAEFQDMMGNMTSFSPSMENPTITATTTTTTTSPSFEMQQIPNYWRRNVMTKRM
jgi:hypothetical protein